jgi:hypothetical protein
MVDRGHLRDHPADTDPCEVCGLVPECADESDRVGGKVAQVVGGLVGVRHRRFAAVTQVVTHHTPTPGGESLAECVGPREHRRSTREHNEGSIVVAEGLDAKGDIVGDHGGHRMTLRKKRPPGPRHRRPHGRPRPSRDDARLSGPMLRY